MPRRSSDEEDVALSALNGFFEGARKGRFAVKDRNELWKLLATITVRMATGRLRPDSPLIKTPARSRLSPDKQVWRIVLVTAIGAPAICFLMFVVQVIRYLNGEKL